MSFQYPLNALRQATIDELNANGMPASAVPHLEGKEDLANHKRWPRFVWAFGDTRNDDDGMIGGKQPRNIYPQRHDFEVHCWGRTRDMAFALQHNLLKAWNDVAQIDVGIVKGKWMPVSANTDGFVYVVSAFLRSSTEDRYVDYLTLPDASESSVVVTRTEGFGYLGEIESGELGVETNL